MELDHPIHGDNCIFNLSQSPDISKTSKTTNDRLCDIFGSYTKYSVALPTYILITSLPQMLYY